MELRNSAASNLLKPGAKNDIVAEALELRAIFGTLKTAQAAKDEIDTVQLRVKDTPQLRTTGWGVSQFQCS